MTRIGELFGSERPTLSFEFFPPATDAGRQQLTGCLDAVRSVDPSFVSVTYGAGGTTRETTRDVVLSINAGESYPAMPHLTCIGHSVAELESLIDEYAAAGIENLLALAGDPPSGSSVAEAELSYASDLVALARGRHDLSIAVAAFPEGHPRSPDLATDRQYLARKLEHADFGITQFFYRIEDYLRMRDDLGRLGCATPVLPGLMPMVNPSVVRRFATMNGAWFPEDLAARIDAAATPADGVAIAVESAAELGAALLTEGVPGVHIYCLNRSDVALGVVDGLRSAS